MEERHIHIEVSDAGGDYSFLITRASWGGEILDIWRRRPHARLLRPSSQLMAAFVCQLTAADLDLLSERQLRALWRYLHRHPPSEGVLEGSILGSYIQHMGVRQYSRVGLGVPEVEGAEYVSGFDWGSRAARDYFSPKIAPGRLRSVKLVTLGNGPFEAGEFKRYLISRGVHPTTQLAPERVVVLGHDGWTREELDRAVLGNGAKDVAVHSQEMVVMWAISGQDPFLGGYEVCSPFARRHAGLSLLSQGWRGWVSIAVEGKGPDGAGMFRGRVDESPLFKLGYRVGEGAPPVGVRRDVLSAAYSGDLPEVESPAYMASWGDPETPRRLRRIAEHLARLVRISGDRRGLAVSDWIDDIDWLKSTYYRGLARFSWLDRCAD